MLSRLLAEIKQKSNTSCYFIPGVGVPSGSSGPSLSTLTPVPTGPADSATLKYGQPGGDTLSDFVTLVCQEAQNAGAHSAQVRGGGTRKGNVKD